VEIGSAVAAAVAAAEACKEPVVLQEVYVSVERATGMHNGRLARVFRRAVKEAQEECRPPGRLRPHAFSS
jgi:hypothetical protein